MIFNRRFKIIFLFSVLGLYLSGLLYFIFDHFFKISGAFGTENHAWQLPTLHVHAILGLLFLFLFGYVYGMHIEPGLKGTRRRFSGIVMVGVIILLSVSVPGLYYLTDGNFKSGTVFVHTYLGLVAPVPFLLHLLWKERRRK